MKDVNKNIEHMNDIQEAPLVQGNHTFGTITEKISSITETAPPKGWWIAFLFSLSLLGLLQVSILYLIFGCLFFSAFYKNSFWLSFNGNGGFVGNFLGESFLISLINNISPRLW